MDNRQELAKRITDICNICLFDINSYIWIRSTETYKNSYFKDEFTLGGGNVVSATYIFSVINSLAKDVEEAEEYFTKRIKNIEKKDI